MTATKKMPITESELKMGQEMSYITFGELIHELTGSSFEEVYKDYLIHGANYNEKSDLE
jgi:hypothetical protein